jgi:hypothetical protein
LFVVRTIALSYLRAIDSKARPCFSTCMLSHIRTIALSLISHLSPLLPPLLPFAHSPLRPLVPSYYLSCSSLRYHSYIRSMPSSISIL